MINAYTVISFGNYETKILIASYVNGELYPIYKTSFLTSDCFQDSFIIDEDLLIKSLEKQFTKIPLDIFATNLILNIPIKDLEIATNKKNDFPISKSNLAYDELLGVVSMGEKQVSSDKVEIDKQIIYWKVNNEEVKDIKKHLSNINKLSWKINSYYVNKAFLNKFVDLISHFNGKPSIVTCDSLVMNNLFLNKERKNKVLINIGHLKSSFDRYENEVLVDQKSHDFGIRHLTSKISKLANVDEQKSIEMLKIYNDIISTGKNIALANKFKEKYMDYTQVTISDISKLIDDWIVQLTSLMTMYLNDKEIDVLGVDEIYFYSSMNVLDSKFNLIRTLLDNRAEIHTIKPNVFGIDEQKYCSLIASIIHFVNLNK